MLDLLNSLSLGSGAVLVAVATAIIAFTIGIFWRNKFIWGLILIIPFPIAYCLYWLPVWLTPFDLDQSEFHAWAWIFIIPFSLAGIVGSLIGFALATWLVLIIKALIKVFSHNRKDTYD